MSIAQNIDQLLFAGDGKLRSEYRRLFKSLFRDERMHREVIQALGGRKSGLTREEILRQVAFADGGKFSECLVSLEECGFIRSFASLGKATKDTLFQLTDNFTLFNLKFMPENAAPDEQFWTSTVTASAQLAWKGLAFERLCLLHMPQIKAALGIAGGRRPLCPFESRHSARLRTFTAIS